MSHASRFLTLGNDDAVMSNCAKECRACEKTCRDMLSQAAGKRRQ